MNPTPPQSLGGGSPAGRRRQSQRRLGAAVLAVVLLSVALYGGYRLVRYTILYPGTRFRPESVEGSQPIAYYLDWRHDLSGLQATRQVLGPDGVIRGPLAAILDDGTADAQDVIQAGLCLHDRLVDEPSPELEEIFRRQIAWLIGEGAEFLPDGRPVWPHRHRMARYGLDPPWVSALTQGQAVSLLIRAAGLTGDSTLIEIARRAGTALVDSTLPMLWRDPDGGLFFEEYPCRPPSHVLNGCLFAWLGLWDLARATGEPRWREACAVSLESIEKQLGTYEYPNGWTRYDAFQSHPTSPAYQEIHAALAEALAAITERPVWIDRSRRWRAAADNPWIRFGVFFQVLGAKITGAISPGKDGVRGLGLRNEPGLPAASGMPPP